MAPQRARPGTPGAHRAVAEVASHLGVQAGVGAPDVEMAMTEVAARLDKIPAIIFTSLG